MCPDFDSTRELNGESRSVTWNLPEGAYCEVRLNGWDNVARVIFDDASNLGVEIPNYAIGDVYSVVGTYEDILLYNAMEEGTVTFTITFSGAFYTTLSSMAVALTTLNYLI